MEVVEPLCTTTHQASWQLHQIETQGVRITSTPIITHKARIIVGVLALRTFVNRNTSTAVGSTFFPSSIITSSCFECFNINITHHDVGPIHSSHAQTLQTITNVIWIKIKISCLQSPENHVRS
jgi:hypothetical protein